MAILLSMLVLQGQGLPELKLEVKLNFRRLEKTVRKLQPEG